MKSDTKKKPKMSKTKPASAGKSKTRRTSTGPGGIELLKTAAALDLKLYAIEGLTNFKQRAIASLHRLEEGGMTYDQYKPSDWILMLQFIRDGHDAVSESFNQGLQDRGFGPDEIFAMIDSNVEEIAWQDAGIIRLSKAIDAKHREYGAKDGETWAEGEAPEDVEELRTAFDQRFLQLKLAILRHHDDNGMADLLENDPDAYDDRVESGRAVFKEKYPDKTDTGSR